MHRSIHAIYPLVLITILLLSPLIYLLLYFYCYHLLLFYYQTFLKNFSNYSYFSKNSAFTFYIIFTLLPPYFKI